MKPTRSYAAPTRSRRLNELLGLALLVAATLMLMALITYTPADPSFDTAGGLAQSARITGAAHPAHNWAGLFGAYFADAVLQLLGVAVFLAPLMLLRVGVSWMRSRDVGHTSAKSGGLLLWLVAAPAAIALLPGHALYRHALPIEGVEGRLLADGLVHVLNLPGAIILSSFLVAASLYLATTFTLATAGSWFYEHFAFVRRTRARYIAWQQQRKDNATNTVIDAYEQKRQQAIEAARTAAFEAGATSSGEAQAAPRSLAEEASLTARDDHREALTQTEPEESHSLLSGLTRLFSRRKSIPADELTGGRASFGFDHGVLGLGHAAAPTAAGVSALHASALAGSALAGSALAAATSLPESALPAEPTLFAEPEAEPVRALSADDDWLNSPERNVPAPTLAPVRAATAPLAEVLPMRPSASLPASLPAARPVPVPLPPMPSPMANIADQNIAFGQRADANLKAVAIAPKSVRGYKLPPSSLLYKSDEHAETREEELLAEANVLVEKCAEFGVDGVVTQINPGPVVTTFEFRPDAGVKVARITALGDDLSLAMAAESVIIERMSGKNTVGIQVPNRTRETIWLRDVVESEKFAQSKSRLAMALGKDINGGIVTVDLASMPHVLIAGSTGSGKSVAINAMIMSVLLKSTPEQVRMILVDPKRVELGMYEGIPHLFTPIITEAKLAANALRNAVKEMERRLKLLAANHVRNIDQFNKLFENGSEYLFEDVNQEPLPYIMIIIDELADLMMLDRANVEESITRLAQMARAVGIHLVLATQRPSVDVITGLLKANVPTRMSFRLATKIDSRTIIDSNGAEALLGRGDMLFLPPASSRLQRVHAPFVTEKEISAVTEFWKAQGEAEYAEGFLEAPKGEGGGEEGSANSGEDADALFDDAVRLVFEFGKASTSLLQRRLRIGYGRAAHLIDMMEHDGLVGPADGSKPRELLKPANFFAEMDAALQ
jgi:S-DNA-T family DNA segregation ATPase FtsK/SpoIIIE